MFKMSINRTNHLLYVSRYLSILCLWSQEIKRK